jgi:crossover junction endodeoxyribonuclease RusA
MLRATLDLPVPPSVNAIWRHGKGRTFRRPEYDEWRRSAGWELRSQKPQSIQGWCAIRVCAAIPKRRRDLDNLLKALFDLLVEHRIIDNDADVAGIEARWDRTVPTGRVHLEVRSSIPPEMRMDASTRKKIAAGNSRRKIIASPAEAA